VDADSAYDLKPGEIIFISITREVVNMKNIKTQSSSKSFADIQTYHRPNQMSVAIALLILLPHTSTKSLQTREQSKILKCAAITVIPRRWRRHDIRACLQRPASDPGEQNGKRFPPTASHAPLACNPDRRLGLALNPSHRGTVRH